MDYTKLNELKSQYGDYEEVFNSGDYDKAADILMKMLDVIELEYEDKRKAGMLDNDLNVRKSEGTDKIWLCTNHIMEYYIYAFYFKPDCDVVLSELPYGEYYRSYGDLCVKSGRYKAGIEAYSNAICWNPVDLDAILGLAECYKYLNMLKRYMIATKEAYRLCCTRATMARYYRNMGFYYLSAYKPEVARACYIYSNIYYKTDNADAELSYIEQALNQETPKLSVKEMQKMFDDEGIEPGPSSDTIGVIYRVGQIMMESQDYQLAKDCFSIVYDITQEEQLEKLLEELENV